MSNADKKPRASYAARELRLAVWHCKHDAERKRYGLAVVGNAERRHRQCRALAAIIIGAGCAPVQGGV